MPDNPKKKKLDRKRVSNQPYEKSYIHAKETHTGIPYWVLTGVFAVGTVLAWMLMP